MKKLSTFIALICFAFTSASAEVGYYSIRDLPSVTSPQWKTQYHATNHTIEVDVDVVIPEVECAPVITVRQMPALNETVYRTLDAWYAQAEKDDRINRYSFRSNDYSTQVTHALPPAWGENRDSDFVAGAMSQEFYDLYDFDMNTAYADNNTLTIAEAIDIAKSQTDKLFPGESLYFRNVHVDGKTFWKNSGKVIRDRGGYSLCMAQSFYGIPFMASIHEAYTQFALNDEDPWLANRGIMRGIVFDENAWSVNCTFYQESSVLYQDIPLLPFDTVKNRIENLILSGHVRWIDSVTLGYVQYDSANAAEQILIPCWVVWCEYHPGGASSERQSGINSSANLMYDGNNDYYRPLIINAQTGELIDPENDNEGRCMPAKILVWEDVR